MGATGGVAGFVASERGFRFTNCFPAEPDVTIDLGAVGKVGLGDASQGVCGGMVFAVRDYFEAGVPVPTIDAPPARGSVLFDYIVRRLIDSFDAPAGIAKYAVWMALPCSDTDVLGLDEPGTSRRTVLESWPAIRADIDAGRPSPLGLVTVHTADLTKIGKCHQALAHAYAIDESNAVTLAVYDPNTPHAQADDVWIRLPLEHPDHGVTITHNLDIGESTLHGFFRSEYTRAAPP